MIDEHFRTRRRDWKDAAAGFCEAIGFTNYAALEKSLAPGPCSCYLYPDVIPSLEVLSGLYRLGVISNATPWQRMDLAGYKIAHYFTAILYSFEAGITKPDVQIFRKMEDRLGAKPEELLYVGDSLSDIRGSKNAGWKAVYIRRSPESNGECEVEADAVINCLLEVTELAEHL